MANPSTLANLVATIESVAAGEEEESVGHDHHEDEQEEETQVVNSEMLEGTVLHFEDGQSINVVQMSGGMEDAINVVQVETSHLGDHVSTVEEICGMEIDSEEQNHILSETGAHVVVKTENDEDAVLQFNASSDQDHQHPGEDKPAIVLPTIPFSFPGQTFDTKCQKLILNVWDFFRRVKKNPDLLDEIRTPQERAAAALHISAATIGKIGKNFKRTGKLETPGKKRKRNKPVVDSVNTEQEDIIRHIIKEFRENRITPTLPLILNECRERINFQGGATSFRRILHRMGYKGFSAKPLTATSPSKSKPLTTSPATASSSAVRLSQSTSVPQMTFKTIKKEPSFITLPVSTSEVFSPSKKVTFKTGVPSSTTVSNRISSTQQVTSKESAASRVVANLLGGNIFQLSTNAKGETIGISQQTAAAIASATGRHGDGPQTIHVLQPDNTVQQIQIVYANIA